MRPIIGTILLIAASMGSAGENMMFEAKPVAAAAFAGEVSNAIRVASEDFVVRYCARNFACLKRYRVAFIHGPVQDRVFFFAGYRPPRTKAELRAFLLIGPNVDYAVSSSGNIVDRYAEQ